MRYLERTKRLELGTKLEIDGVLYEHGTGSTGANGARNRAIANRQSTVVGHSHSFGGVRMLYGK